MRKRIKSRKRNEGEKSRTTISLSAELLAAGIEQARGQRRNFSNYVEFLISKDLQGAQVAV